MNLGSLSRYNYLRITYWIYNKQVGTGHKDLSTTDLSSSGGARITDNYGSIAGYCQRTYSLNAENGILSFGAGYCGNPGHCEPNASIILRRVYGFTVQSVNEVDD